MYASLADAVLTGADEAQVERRVERLRQRHPGLSRDELAEKLIRQTARRCAAVGALTGAPAAWLGASPASADLVFQVMALTRLALGIAAIYRRRLDLSERGLCAAGSLALSAGAGAVRAGAVKLARQALGRRRSGSAAPVLGALLSGALSYGAVLAFGRAARDHYRGRG
ncbi:MAG: hypothetical protein ACRD1B_06770 [Thermoanaerobaculia bacterium]